MVKDFINFKLLINVFNKFFYFPLQKFIVVALALVGCVLADVSELGYDYHAPAPAPVEHYHQEHYEVFASVPEITSNAYIPPPVSAPAPAPVYHHAPAPAPVHVHAPAPVYASAPAIQSSYIPPPVSGPVHIPAPAPIQHTAEFGDDGYRYKVVRRRVYRRRF